MSNLAQINRKIKSVKLTNRLTRALEVISQTQFHMYKELQKKSLPYLQGIYKVFFEIFNSPDHDVRLTNKKLISINPSMGTLWVVLGTDIGMCGDFNDKIKNFILDEFNFGQDRHSSFSSASSEPSISSSDNSVAKETNSKDSNSNSVHKEEWQSGDGLIIYGNKLINGLGERLTRRIEFSRKSEIDNSKIAKSFKEISHKAFEIFMSRNYQKLVLVYLKNPKLGVVEKLNILPFSQDYLKTRKKVYIQTLNASVEYPDSVIELFPQYLECIVMGSLINSKISEHGIRRELMHSAAKNASELLEEYMISFNKLRQEKITQEITEIVSAIQTKKKQR